LADIQTIIGFPRQAKQYAVDKISAAKDHQYSIELIRRVSNALNRDTKQAYPNDRSVQNLYANRIETAIRHFYLNKISKSLAIGSVSALGGLISAGFTPELVSHFLDLSISPADGGILGGILTFGLLTYADAFSINDIQYQQELRFMSEFAVIEAINRDMHIPAGVLRKVIGDSSSLGETTRQMFGVSVSGNEFNWPTSFDDHVSESMLRQAVFDRYVVGAKALKSLEWEPAHDLIRDVQAYEAQGRAQVEPEAGSLNELVASALDGFLHNPVDESATLTQFAIEMVPFFDLSNQEIGRNELERSADTGAIKAALESERLVHERRLEKLRKYKELESFGLTGPISDIATQIILQTDQINRLHQLHTALAAVGEGEWDDALLNALQHRRRHEQQIVLRQSNYERELAGSLGNVEASLARHGGNMATIDALKHSRK